MRSATLIGVLLLIPSACGRAPAIHSSQPSSLPLHEISISGDDGRILMDALAAAGVVDTDQLLGAVNLRARSLHCRTPVVPRPWANCDLLVDGDATVRGLPLELAPQLFQLLARAGAPVTTRLGMATVRAATIHCSRPIVPEPVSRCSFTVL